jgi:hypothetical protein
LWRVARHNNAAQVAEILHGLLTLRTVHFLLLTLREWSLKYCRHCGSRRKGKCRRVQPRPNATLHNHPVIRSKSATRKGFMVLTPLLLTLA